jgi:hypothetical protein
MNAYTISDRGTWLSFANEGDLAVLVESDPQLLNRYDVILPRSWSSTGTEGSNPVAPVLSLSPIRFWNRRHSAFLTVRHETPSPSITPVGVTDVCRLPQLEDVWLDQWPLRQGRAADATIEHAHRASIPLIQVVITLATLPSA